MSDLQKVSNDLFHLLKEKKIIMVTAESCTGGLISKTMTDYAGSSNIIWGAFVTYSNEAKNKLLKVPTETLESFGAVSEETVISMAEGALKESGVDCSVAVSGIAGPGGGSSEKPVGTVWISAAFKNNRIAKCYHFQGNREDIRRETAIEALRMLIELISGN